MKKTAKYYASNPEARAKKKSYDTKLNKKPGQVKKRVEANKANRKAGTYGNGDGIDMAHTKKGIVKKKQSVNRGSKSDMAGDRRARGGKK
jgi:hypothetical protein